MLTNCIHNPASNCATENGKHYSRKKTNGWLLRKPVQRSLVKCSVGKVIPHANLDRQKTSCKFGRSTPRRLELIWKSLDSCKGILNSGRSWAQLIEQPMIQIRKKLVQHTQPSNVATMAQCEETLVRQGLDSECTGRSESWRWQSAADHNTEEQYSCVQEHFCIQKIVIWSTKASRIGSMNTRWQRSNT